MKPILQTKFDKEGNCLAACIASILEIDINEIPDLPDEPAGEWFLIINEFLNPRGYYYLTVDVLDDRMPILGYHIMQGMTKKGYHAVVGKNKIVVHDPTGTIKELSDVSYGLLVKVIE